jgi:hypothetical protein
LCERFEFTTALSWLERPLKAGRNAVVTRFFYSSSPVTAFFLPGSFDFTSMGG